MMMVLKVGMKVRRTVTGIQPYGVFVDLGDQNQGLIHISECRSGYVADINQLFSVGDSVETLIIDIDEFTGKISLSTRAQAVNLNVLKHLKPVHRRRYHYWTDYQLSIGFTSLAEMRGEWLNEAEKIF